MFFLIAQRLRQQRRLHRHRGQLHVRLPGRLRRRRADLHEHQRVRGPGAEQLRQQRGLPGPRSGILVHMQGRLQVRMKQQLL